MNTSTLQEILRNPLNLIMLALVFAAGLCSSWILLPIGLVVFALMIFLQLRDPTLRINQSLRERKPLAYRFQQKFNKIERTQIRIFNTIRGANSEMQKILQPINEAVDGLVNEVYQLCERMTVLENHRLVSQTRTDLENALAEINQKINSATDSVVKQEYEASRRSIEAKLDGDRKVAVLLDRTEAQLSSVANELDRVLTEVVQCMSLTRDEALQQVPEILRQISAEENDMRNFQRIER